MSLYIGLMSGTSMDGIDAALVEMPSNTLLCGMTKKYSPSLKAAINNLINEKHVTLANLCQTNTLIGREFAVAVEELLLEARIPAEEVVAIGSHGQTVCHDTSGDVPYTLQLGCAHTIALRTGIDVIADFRTKDLVNGGQGAPFAPLYHQELFGKFKDNIALVNIGGIANVTFIKSQEAVVGWDVGPGNCLLDAWIYKHQNKDFDRNGAWASQGVVIEPLLQQLLEDPFFGQSTPKSIGKEYFSLSWLEPYLKREYSPSDVQATLSALTALTIAQAILNKMPINRMYLCGGGTHNAQLGSMLGQYLPELTIQSVQEIGINPDYLEAMMFAWFASQTIASKPVDLAAITGSRSPEILGALYPKAVRLV